MQWFYSAAFASTRFPPLLWLVPLMLIVGLVLFSQTLAWYGDEGFHLLASQLIMSGKQPYLDFFYPQTPMWAYLNAGWMRIFGDTWRTSHILAVLLTGGSIIQVATFVFARIPEDKWRLTAALIAAILMGTHTVVIGFGTVGQAYGICLFLITAAFRLVAKGIDQTRPALFLPSGFCSGLAAGSSLLSAPVLLILLIWTATRSVIGRRLTFCIWFLLGAVLSSLPWIWLAVLAPHQTFFNTFEHHFFYRSPDNWLAFRVSVRTLTELLNSVQFMLLVVFAAIGLLFVSGRSQWGAKRKAEFYLCGWLAAGLGIFLITIRITFYQYFILLTPFLSILAAVGITTAASWLRSPGRPAWLVPAALFLFVAGVPWWLWQQRVRLSWPQLQEVARVINQIVPQNELIWADAMIY